MYMYIYIHIFIYTHICICINIHSDVHNSLLMFYSVFKSSTLFVSNREILEG